MFSASNLFSQGLVFQNVRLESAKAGADKAVYRFPNVKTGYDALVTIMGRSSTKVSLVNIDVTTSGHPQAFQPQVTFNSGTATGYAYWYMDFDVVLVKTGTTIRTATDEIDVTAIDVDGNGDKIREFIVYTNPVNVEIESVTSLVPDEHPVIDFSAENGDPVLCTKCSKSSPIILCVTCNGSGIVNTIIGGVVTPGSCSKCNGVGKVHSLCGHPYVATKTGNSFLYMGPFTNYANIDTLATTVMVTGTWLNTDEVIFRIGAQNVSSGNQGAADRMYSLWFKTFRYLGSTFLPVSLVDWKANLVKNNVVLNWTSLMEKDLSHYTIERSFDGVNYDKVATLNAIANGSIRKNYTYTDKIDKINQGTIYYRLKSADINGKDRISEVRVIRTINVTNTLAITAYPNPVVNELRISVPTKCHGKSVNFELYNINGIAVKRVVSQSAGNTETVNVQDLSAGLYIVKATYGTESAIQRVMKSK